MVSWNEHPTGGEPRRRDAASARSGLGAVGHVLRFRQGMAAGDATGSGGRGGPYVQCWHGAIGCCPQADAVDEDHDRKVLRGRLHQQEHVPALLARVLSGQEGRHLGQKDPDLDHRNRCRHRNLAPQTHTSCHHPQLAAVLHQRAPLCLREEHVLLAGVGAFRSVLTCCGRY